VGRTCERAGERQAGEQCPNRASHPLYIGAVRVERDATGG
jgi:hypothetical protein